MFEMNLAAMRYQVKAYLTDGTMVDLTNACKSIGLEENRNEYSERLNLTLMDTDYAGARLSQLLPLCTKLFVYAGEKGNSTKEEVWRGSIWEWQHSDTPGDPVILTAYDLLYYLQKSQDNQYFAKGRTTRSVIESVLQEWGVTIGEYQGPEVTHDKLVFKRKRISDILQETLEDAEYNKGAKKCFVRARNGSVDILPYGHNQEAWCFSSGKHVLSVTDKYSMTDLVTRVVITGKEPRKGRPKVVKTLDGSTEFGILQQFQSKGSGSLEDARRAAEKILRDNGKPKRTVTVETLDVPTLRKGDLVYMDCGLLTGAFTVMGVSHDATKLSMTMDLEEEE